MNAGMPISTCGVPAGWATFHTGNSIPAPTQFPVRITDGCGLYYTINNQQELDSLSECLVNLVQRGNQDFSIQLIPNPSDGNQHLIINSEKPGLVKISLTDITGRQVAYYETIIAKGRNEIFVNDFFSQKSPGYYYLTVENGTSKKTIGLLQ